MPTAVFLPAGQRPTDFLSDHIRRTLETEYELQAAEESVPGEVYFLIRNKTTGRTGLYTTGYEQFPVDGSAGLPANFSFGHLWSECSGMYLTAPPAHFLERTTPLPYVDETLTEPLMTQLRHLEDQATAEASLEACAVAEQLRVLDPDFVARRYRQEVRRWQSAQASAHV